MGATVNEYTATVTCAREGCDSISRAATVLAARYNAIEFAGWKQAPEGLICRSCAEKDRS